MPGLPPELPQGDDPLLFARVLDGRGGGRDIGWAEAQAWQRGAEREVLWLHLYRAGAGLEEYLHDVLCIPGPTVGLLTSDSTRPRAFRDGETLVATLRGVNVNPGAEPEDMVTMQLWSDGQRLVTLRREPLRTPHDVLEAIDAGAGARDAGALLTDLVSALIGRMSHSIVDLNEQIDLLEAADPAANSEEILTHIAAVRRGALGLKRHMGPQHEALEAILRDAPAWVQKRDRRGIGESIGRLRHYLDDLDVSKESALVLQDDIRARALARSERNNLLLAVVASIFLPLGFLTGLLGINVGGIPGAENADAFWIVCGICGAIFLLQLWLFRRWKLL